VNITSHDNKVHELTKNNEEFYFAIGVTVYPRASIRLSERCPQPVVDTLQWAVDSGYVSAVAYVPGSVLTWEILNRE